MGVTRLPLVKEVSLPRRVNTPAGTTLNTDLRELHVQIGECIVFNHRDFLRPELPFFLGNFLINSGWKLRSHLIVSSVVFRPLNIVRPSS
eukprot:14869010-Ditylum_brightwellii.AAC.1